MTPLWVADKDGIGHATVRRHASWTLCELRATPERFGYPIRQRCLECTAKADDLARAAKGGVPFPL